MEESMDSLNFIFAGGLSLFRIGDFSRLSCVSIKALRYYDELGLLKPERVDPFTGYRYYNAEQLPVLNSIIALKDLGFTLDQITLMKGGKISLENIKSILKAKRQEIERQISLEQEKLLRVEARIKLIESANSIPGNIDVIVKKIEPLRVIGTRQIVGDCYSCEGYEAGHQGTILDKDIINSYPGIATIFEQICHLVLSKGGKLVPPGISVFYESEYKDTNVDMEAAIPANGLEVNENGIRTFTLPGVSCAACLIHRGAYDTMIQVYDNLMKWIDENGYKIVGPVRELYLQSVGYGTTSQDECITEVQFPVDKQSPDKK